MGHSNSPIGTVDDSRSLVSGVTTRKQRMKLGVSSPEISDYPLAITAGTKPFECGFKWNGDTRCSSAHYWGVPPHHQCRATVLPGTVHAHRCGCGEKEKD